MAADAEGPDVSGDGDVVGGGDRGPRYVLAGSDVARARVEPGA